MKAKLLAKYRNLPLAVRIRLSYFVILIPFIFLLLICFWNMWETNSRYDEMIESAVVASSFSQDFKTELDEEIYFLTTGHKTIENSDADQILDDAQRVVDSLKKLTDSAEDKKSLENAEKYISNLRVYKSRIEDNLKNGADTSLNETIFKDDVQIGTSLLQETMTDFIYNEIIDFQAAREEYMVTFQKIVLAMVIAMIALFGLTIVFSYLIPKSISNPIKKISMVTDQVSKGDLAVRSDVEYGGEVGVLSDSLNAMIDKINELLDQVTKEQIRLRKAELELLQAQINPHFLYNTLDTIVWLAEGSDQKTVVSMVKSLSDFFRTSLNQGKDIISLRDELVHVRSYLEIQQVRYQDILEYEIDVPEELYDIQIPKITLQPLVENALYHGIKNKRTGGKITIKGKSDDRIAILTVEDNGLGMKEERLQQINKKLNKHAQDDEIYGISNVNERIQLKFGDAYGLAIDSIYDKGTRVEIYLPIPDEKNKPQE